MSNHGKLRENKACENCGHFVEKRFCPECGQENVETRQPFHYLFTVSIEDFVHYDSRFWKTILYLLFYPARLTKIYLSGKRKLHVPPVTLFIFISFITFFIPTILPDLNSKKNTKTSEVVTTTYEKTKDDDERINSDKSEQKKDEDNQKKTSRQNSGKKLKINGGEINDQNFDMDKWQERIIHDFPKAIFLYMPIFAFWLWLFHNKKKWYYFDHGIFTLHYFSFILLSCLLLIFIRWLIPFLDLNKIGLISFIYKIFPAVMLGYFLYYFFHSHRIIYQESKAISRLKCSFLFFINTFCMLIFLVLYLIFEVYITDKNLFTEIITKLNE